MNHTKWKTNHMMKPKLWVQIKQQKNCMDTTQTKHVSIVLGNVKLNPTKKELNYTAHPIANE
jgi:hypothetical protein